MTSLCSSSLRARSSAVYELCNILKFSLRLNPLKQIYNVLLVTCHYGNLCVVVIYCERDTEKNI